MPRLVTEHALDREVGLAGVGGAEDGRQAAGSAAKRLGVTFARGRPEPAPLYAPPHTGGGFGSIRLEV